MQALATRGNITAPDSYQSAYVCERCGKDGPDLLNVQFEAPSVYGLQPWFFFFHPACLRDLFLQNVQYIFSGVKLDRLDLPH